MVGTDTPLHNLFYMPIGSIYTGDDIFQPLYQEEKLSKLGFYAVFKEDGVTMAKAQNKGMTTKPCVEVTAGVDLFGGWRMCCGRLDLAGAGVY